jgi:hypothetical protein
MVKETVDDYDATAHQDTIPAHTIFKFKNHKYATYEDTPLNDHTTKTVNVVRVSKLKNNTNYLNNDYARKDISTQDLRTHIKEVNKLSNERRKNIAKKLNLFIKASDHGVDDMINESTKNIFSDTREQLLNKFDGMDFKEKQNLVDNKLKLTGIDVERLKQQVSKLIDHKSILSPEIRENIDKAYENVYENAEQTDLYGMNQQNDGRDSYNHHKEDYESDSYEPYQEDYDPHQQNNMNQQNNRRNLYNQYQPDDRRYSHDMPHFRGIRHPFGGGKKKTMKKKKKIKKKTMKKEDDKKKKKIKKKINKKTIKLS